VGASWSAEITGYSPSEAAAVKAKIHDASNNSRSLAEMYLRRRGKVEGVNKRTAYYLGTGDTIIEAFCAAVAHAVKGLSVTIGINWAPITSSARMKKATRQKSKKLTGNMPIKSFKEKQSSASATFTSNIHSSTSAMFNSKFKIGTTTKLLRFSSSSESWLSETFIKSPKASLNCFRAKDFGLNLSEREFDYRFKSKDKNIVSIMDFFEDFSQKAMLKVFRGEDTKANPDRFTRVTIVFGSRTNSWQ
jgi:hypothetical protein